MVDFDNNEIISIVVYGHIGDIAWEDVPDGFKVLLNNGVHLVHGKTAFAMRCDRRLFVICFSFNMMGEGRQIKPCLTFTVSAGRLSDKEKLN